MDRGTFLALVWMFIKTSYDFLDLEYVDVDFKITVEVILEQQRTLCYKNCNSMGYDARDYCGQ